MANSSSIAVCLAGVKDFWRNCFIELWVVGAGGWVAGWGVKMEAVVADAEEAVVLAPEEAAAVALALADGCGSFSVLDSSSNTAACDVRMCLCRLLLEPAR